VELVGTYAGTVEGNKDPSKMGRAKVRVPHVYGDADEVPTESLPWALPAGLPAGSDHGISWLPDIGDHVWVRFLDGEPEKPIWEWGMQDKTQAEGGPFQSYDTDQTTGEFKQNPVKSSLMRRYGHTIDMSPGSIVATTKYGYSLLVTDSDALQGSVALRTAMAQTVELSDATQTLMILANQLYEIIYSNAVFHAGNLIINITDGDWTNNVVGSLSTLVEGAATWTVQGPTAITSNDITLDADTTILSMIPASMDVTTPLLNLDVAEIAGNVTGNALIDIIGNLTINPTGIFTIAGQNSVLIGTISGQTLNLSSGPRLLQISAAGFNFT
jgi:hypothetical protein